MRQVAHHTPQADPAAEKAALRAFQRKVVRVTLLVLLGLGLLAAWSWVQGEPARAAFDWLGGSLTALIALKLVLGVLPAEACLRVVLRIVQSRAASTPVVRAYYWFLGYMMATPMGVKRSDTWWLDGAALAAFVAVALVSIRRRNRSRTADNKEPKSL